MSVLSIKEGERPVEVPLGDVNLEIRIPHRKESRKQVWPLPIIYFCQKNHLFVWMANDPLSGRILFSFLPPSNSLVLVLDA